MAHALVRARRFRGLGCCSSVGIESHSPFFWLWGARYGTKMKIVAWGVNGAGRYGDSIRASHWARNSRSTSYKQQTVLFMLDSIWRGSKHTHLSSVFRTAWLTSGAQC